MGAALDLRARWSSKHVFLDQALKQSGSRPRNKLLNHKPGQMTTIRAPEAGESPRSDLSWVSPTQGSLFATCPWSYIKRAGEACRRAKDKATKGLRRHLRP